MHIQTELLMIIFILFALSHVLFNLVSHFQMFKGEQVKAWIRLTEVVHYLLR